MTDAFDECICFTEKEKEMAGENENEKRKRQTNQTDRKKEKKKKRENESGRPHFPPSGFSFLIHPRVNGVIDFICLFIFLVIWPR